MRAKENAHHLGKDKPTHPRRMAPGWADLDTLIFCLKNGQSVPNKPKKNAPMGNASEKRRSGGERQFCYLASKPTASPS